MNQNVDLVGWNTPRATDGTNGGPNQAGGALPADAALTGGATPAARDHKSEAASEEFQALRMEQTRGKPLSWEAGLISESSPAQTESRGVLDAAFSRWLMGFPAAWDQASPNFQNWCGVQDRIVSAA
jgi:hypothetical protein